MLREQDDPDSLIGKASDDSVLFPKRASRLNLFGHSPNLLADIDEASIDGRPSINLGRTDSFVSGGDGGYGTDDDRSHNGSIMSRARRAEGNNLFGGRQKVYKIPTKSGNGSGTESGRAPVGRALYEHDLSMSAFQRLKLKEKEEERAAEETQHGSPAQESEDGLSSISSMKRTASSSTASGPTANGRTSTAATSIDEEPSSTASGAGENFKPGFIGAMAPERGSVKSRRLYGQGLAQSAQNQQNTTLYRLESLSRQRVGTPELPLLNRTYSRSATNLRDRLQKLAITEPTLETSRPNSPPPSSATSPKLPSIDSDPKGPKSQLTPGYGVPPLSPPVSENEEVGTLAAALQPEDHGKATAMGLFNKPQTAFDENQFTRRQLQMHQGRSTPPLRRAPSPPGRMTPQERSGRSRGLSNTSGWSRPESASSHYSESHRAANHSIAPSIEASPAAPANGTFFANSSPDASDDEGDEFNARDVAAAIDAVHPAFRSSPPSKPATPPEEHQSVLPEVRFSDLGDLKPIAENEASESASVADSNALPEKPDSPTLGPSGLGLSGLIRTHLRRDSDRSSFHVPHSPAFPPEPNDDDVDRSVANGSDTVDGYSQRASTDGNSSRDSQDNSKVLPWEDELKSKHRRQGSTETQREREEFEIELAERRRRVQEKLRGFAESESRSASPISGRQTPDYPPQTKPGNAFALLKSKNPKHPFFSRQDPKNSKTLGLASASTPSLVPDDPWREEDEKMPFSFGKHSNTSSPQIAGERSIRSRMAAFGGRSSHEDSRESSRSRGASPHSSMRSQRDRSSSDASGRSKSRTRYRDRDDLGTLEEDAAGPPEPFPHFDQRAAPSVPASTRPSVEVNDRSASYDRCSSAASGRYRSGSRSATSSYFDRPPVPPPSTNPSMIGVSPRPSPIAPYSANATPPLHEMSPNPSTTSLPTHATAAHTLPQRAPGHGGLQKRVIDKTQISEPTFLSCTSNVPTVGLPPGASLSNGMETPPIPPMNPRRRRQTTTQTILGALKGEKHESYYPASIVSSPPEEHSTFSDDNNKRPKSRHNKLRKTSSEGGSLNSKARQQAMAAAPALPTPAIPQYPPPNIPMEGGMF
ncbi:uncharacterized protein CDV56_109143 [Aspergillus thermomutatus]|uniref:Uncharacterized protein n=1 Tax=Aspergillus thermomutatus TaxID=41047 RepID=A0A397HQY9_ASPTH|nr:uncharacterized protein CDV56_109143 [Aspergillus thermomutatus]RHZ64016.1 hypothetical protein CDV56_109143 [Aspergillus thermomutatus]